MGAGWFGGEQIAHDDPEFPWPNLQDPDARTPLNTSVPYHSPNELADALRISKGRVMGAIHNSQVIAPRDDEGNYRIPPHVFRNTLQRGLE